MGENVERDSFTPADYEEFGKRLQGNLLALARVLERPGFGAGEMSIGAEVEFNLVDAAGRPLPISRTVLARALDGKLALELDNFNLEYNSDPVALQGQPFTNLGRQLEGAFAEIGATAAESGGQVALVGVLPTLVEADLQADAMTQLPRFKALAAGIRRIRDDPFRVQIRGEEEVDISCDEVTMEGANTAYQLHLRVPPGRFAQVFNAAQLASAPVLAIACNSPIFLGRKLWQETRVALFRQAIDPRREADAWRPSRVSFGSGWARRGALELFEEAVALHEPLLPVVGDEDAVQCVDRGGNPTLRELRLHIGTVWSWNRPVYDAADGGHLRLEMRTLPSGPTVLDMMANSAFLCGLTLDLAKDIDRLLPAIPFRFAQENFYSVAEHGLDATVCWPSASPPSPRRVRVADLLPQLLRRAHDGLVNHGIASDEARRHLDLVAARASSRVNGSRWQLRQLAELELSMPREQALVEMFKRYLSCSAGGSPVHTWPIDAG